MDVKCERCGTEYEFDDAKVTAAGITVKCTHCGHLFKVVREEAPSEPVPQRTPPGGIPASEGVSRSPIPTRWRIRRATGEELEFNDLTTLQQWILERKVAPEDQISKTGDSWKPLGSIVELSSFFLAVQGAPESSDNGPAPRRSPFPTPSPGPAPPPPRDRDDLLDTGEFSLDVPTRTPSSGGVPMPTSPAPRDDEKTNPRATQPEAPARKPPPPPPPAPREQNAFVFGGGSSPGLGGPEMSPIDGFGAPPPSRSTGVRLFLIAALALSLLLAAAVWWLEDRLKRLESQTTGQVARTTEAPRGAGDEQKASAALDRGDAAYRLDSPAAFERATEAYQEAADALGSPPANPTLAARAYAGRAAVDIARAEYATLAGEDGAQHLKAAEDTLIMGRTVAPGAPALDLAFADYYRVSGEVRTAEALLDKHGEAAAKQPSAMVTRAAFGLHAGESEPGKAGDTARAARAAEVAGRLEQLSPEARALPRVGYLRAEALQRAGRKDAAVAALVELLAANPEHTWGRALLKRLRGDDGGAAAKPETPAVGKPAVAKPAVAKPAVGKPAVDQPTDKKPPVPISARPSAREDAYDRQMDKGDRLLRAGRAQAAIAVFQEAAKQRPRSPEPIANLAWCYMDLRQYDRAIAQFQKALQRSGRYADAMYGLAEAQERAGKKSDAIRSYSRYLEVHPRGRNAAMAQRKIEQLR